MYEKDIDRDVFDGPMEVEKEYSYDSHIKQLHELAYRLGRAVKPVVVDDVRKSPDTAPIRISQNTATKLSSDLQGVIDHFEEIISRINV